MARRLPLFATCARGTEDLLADELEDLGCSRVTRERGGVRFQANLDEALRICLWTRIAMRVLYPLGDFPAHDADGLYAAASEVPWEEHLTRHATFAVEATLRQGEPGDSRFVALKIKDALVDRLRERLGARPDVDKRDPDVQVVAHLAHGRLGLSLDLAGEPLHRRGYRVKPTSAPLKETLAAAILRAVGFRAGEPLVDPMCGSGTFPIEAALVAENVAPGARRALAVERWPHLGEQARAVLADLRADARKARRKAEHPIVGFDRDEEAVDAARRNAAAAGVRGAVRIEPADATGTPRMPAPSGLLVTNPPYGDRLSAGGQKGMKSFYFQLGESLGRIEGWRMAILAGNPAFESAFHHRPAHRRRLWNGPIECMLLEYPARASSRSA